VNRPTTEILPLTSLRFFAAFYVLLYHTLRGPFALGDGWFGRLIGAGHVSVSFFFTLSGYILALVYLSRGTPIGRGNFWMARVARIYPVFILTMLLDIPFAILSRLDHLDLFNATIKVAGGFAVELLMLQAWHLNWRVLDAPNWSLSAEAFFYILFPFIGLALWRMRPSRLLTLTAVLWLIGMCADLLALRHGFTEKAVMFNPVLHLPEFVGGIAICSCQRRLGAVRAPVLLAASCLLFLVAVFARAPRILMNNGLLFPVFAMIILATSSGHPTITRLLSARWLVNLGGASYALYLLHVPAWEVLEHAHLDRSALAYVAYLVSTVIASMAIFHLLEEPARRAIKNAYEARSSSMAQEALLVPHSSCHQAGKDHRM